MLPTDQPASAEPIEPKPEQSLEQPKNAPAEEAFDKERAMELITKLREIEKQYKQDKKKFDQLEAEEKKRKDAELSEVERLRKQADELAEQKAKLESDILRRDVITETGLPAFFAERLKGATKEELLADAEALKKSLPQLKQPSQAITNPGQATANETEEQRRERLFGRQGNPFDMDVVTQMGGGVVKRSK